MTQPTKSSKLRNSKHGGSAFNTLPLCPSCGGTRPERSLILCRPCWSELPQPLKLEAVTAAKTDRTSIALGPVAAAVIASVSVPKGLDEAEAA